MVVTPGGSWEGVKFTATSTTYHGIVLALEIPGRNEPFCKHVFRECQILQSPRQYVYK